MRVGGNWLYFSPLTALIGPGLIFQPLSDHLSVPPGGVRRPQVSVWGSPFPHGKRHQRRASHGSAGFVAFYTFVVTLAWHFIKI